VALHRNTPEIQAEMAVEQIRWSSWSPTVRLLRLGVPLHLSRTKGALLKVSTTVNIYERASEIPSTRRQEEGHQVADFFGFTWTSQGNMHAPFISHNTF
jgi:hypothetical protein